MIRRPRLSAEQIIERAERAEDTRMRRRKRRWIWLAILLGAASAAALLKFILS